MIGRIGLARLAAAVLALAAWLPAAAAEAPPSPLPDTLSAPEPAGIPAPATAPAPAQGGPAAGVPQPEETAAPGSPDDPDEAPPALGPRGIPASRDAQGSEEDEERPARRIRKHPRFKSDLWLPLGSVFLPGFGQYFQRDWTGAAYTGAAAIGYVLMVKGLAETVADDADGRIDDPDAPFTTQSWSYRKIVLGELAYQGSGFLSAYSAFRISIPRFQKEDGRYGFLGPGESVGQLMAAPFRFDHLAEPSAFIPLGLLAGGVGYLVGYERSHHRGVRWTLSGDDFLFTGAEAWNAGVSEEAAFRGWLYPMAYQYLWNDFWLADGAQALLFGLAHFDPDANPFPWPQALLGFYFGWLTKKNGWTLSESIFVHAWWDMILFAGEVATTFEDPGTRAAFRIDLPMKW